MRLHSPPVPRLAVFLRTHSVLFFLAAFCALPSCARHADKTPLQDASIFTGPTAKDTNLVLLPLSMELRLEQLRILPREMPTSEYLRIIDELESLSRFENDGQIHDLAARLHEALYNSAHNFTTVSLDQSLYAEAAIGEGEAMVRPLLGQTSTDIQLTLNLMNGLLDRSQREFPWPSSFTTFTEALAAADLYVSWIDNQISSLGLNEKLRPIIQSALTSEYRKFRPLIQKCTTELAASRNFAEALSAINSALKAFSVNLPADQKALLEEADELSQQLDAIETPQDVLSTLVFVWQVLPENTRQAFEKISPEFYDYLAAKSQAELSCLSVTVCLNPLLLVTKTVVLGKISSMGVTQIRDQLDTAALHFLQDTARAQIVLLLPKVPAMAKGRLMAEAGKYTDLLNSISSDFSGFTRARLRAWKSQHFTAGLRGLEPEQVTVNVASSERLTVSVNTGSGLLRSGAEALGLSLSQSYLPVDPEARKAALVEPVMKLLAMSGFRQFGGDIFPSLFFALDGKPEDTFDIRGLLKSPTSFAVPDTFITRANFSLDRGQVRANASVASQAELIRGISHQIRSFRDWEKNEFDESLGDMDVSELLPEIPKGSFTYPLFPKSLVFALALGDAGAILQNVVRDLSPAFLLLRQGEIFWGNRYREIQGENVSVVAGLVPIIDGKRAGFVRTGDVARYILALNEFLSATEGAEKTKSSALLEKNANGISTIDQLLEARKSLRLFQMALTNYLVFVSQHKDGTQSSQQILPGLLNDSAEPLNLEDQALAIRALLASSHSLEIPVFRWAALDTYYGMNRNFFDRASAFYSAKPILDGKAASPSSLQQIALTLLAGEELSPFMPDEVRKQWKLISRPWLKALRDF